MNIKDYLMKYRFSFVDLLWIMITAQLFMNGMFLFGIASAAGGAASTILIEMKLKKSSENEKQSLKDLEWKRLADEGHIVDAIKRCRSVHGLGLKDARDTVYQYLGKPI